MFNTENLLVGKKFKVLKHPSKMRQGVCISDWSDCLCIFFVYRFVDVATLSSRVASFEPACRGETQPESWLG